MALLTAGSAMATMPGTNGLSEPSSRVTAVDRSCELDAKTPLETSNRYDGDVCARITSWVPAVRS